MVHCYIIKKKGKKKIGRVVVDVKLRRLGGVVWIGWRVGLSNLNYKKKNV